MAPQRRRNSWCCTRKGTSGANKKKRPLPKRAPKSKRQLVPSGLVLFVGAYEEDLVALRVDVDGEGPSLKHLVTDHGRGGAIRCLRQCGKYLASGGADGRVVVSDLVEETAWEVQLEHEEAVNCMDFSADGKYLFVGGWDRNVYIVDVERRMISCRKWNVHTAPILAVRVCPAGRNMVSVGQDRTMRVWDFLSGKSMLTDLYRNDERFDDAIWFLEFSPSGKLLAAVGTDFTEVSCPSEGKIVRSVSYSGRPTAAVWLSESAMAVGISSGSVITFGTDDKRVPDETRLYYDSRLKAMVRVGNHLATASSIGKVTLWTVDDDRRIWPLCSLEVGCRPTSLIMMDTAKEGLKGFVPRMQKVQQHWEASGLVPSDISGVANLETTQTSGLNPPDNSIVEPEPEDCSMESLPEVTITEMAIDVETSPTGLRNNSFGDTPPQDDSDDDSVQFVSEELLEPESSDEAVDDEEEDLSGDNPKNDQLVPTSVIESVDSLKITQLEVIAEESSMETLQVSSSYDLITSTMKPCAERPPTPRPLPTDNSDSDDDDSVKLVIDESVEQSPDRDVPIVPENYLMRTYLGSLPDPAEMVANFDAGLAEDLFGVATPPPSPIDVERPEGAGGDGVVADVPNRWWV